MIFIAHYFEKNNPETRYAYSMSLNTMDLNTVSPQIACVQNIALFETMLLHHNHEGSQNLASLIFWSEICLRYEYENLLLRSTAKI